MAKSLYQRPLVATHRTYENIGAGNHDPDGDGASGMLCGSYCHFLAVMQLAQSLLIKFGHRVIPIGSMDARGAEQFTGQWASHDETPLRLERGAGPAFMCAAGDPEYDAAEREGLRCDRLSVRMGDSGNSCVAPLQ